MAAAVDRSEGLRSEFGAIAAGAPTADLRAKVVAISDNLRSFSSSVEAERMLRSGVLPPTAEQLESATVAVESHRLALEGAVDALRATPGLVG
jgi:hypothetical protein